MEFRCNYRNLTGEDFVNKVLEMLPNRFVLGLMPIRKGSKLKL